MDTTTLLPSTAGSVLLLAMALAGDARASDPTSAECVAASQAANDLQNQRQLRAARARFAVCAASSCPEEVQKYCVERVEQVNGELPTIVFEAKDDRGNDLSAVKIAMDGEPWADRLDGAAVAVDPGSHKFVFETAGAPPVEKTFVLRVGEQNRHETVILATQAPAPAPKPRESAPPSRTIAIALGATGAAALGTSLVLGALVFSEKSQYQKNCGANIGAPPDFCNDQGIDDHDAAKSKATAATLLFIGGAAALGAGAFLYFTAPRVAPSAEVGLGPRGFEVRGHF